jgi:hypothetical protein
MDMLLALFTFAALIYFVGWEDYLKPLLGLDRPKSVKSSPDRASIKLRSRRSRRSNGANAGSAHHSAPEAPANVPANVPRSPAHVAPGGEWPPAAADVVMSRNELQQLAEAVAARAGGATIEESIYRGFGLRKGGGPGYRRARELFDLATAPPQPKV